jgi:drug/metabolite transporter (DMT)-like permease
VLGKQDLSSWNLALSSGVLILSGICLEALVFVFSKKTKAHFTSTQYLAISQVSASLFMWILQAAWWQQTNQLDQLSAKGITAALFVSIVACVLCYSVLYWLLNYLDGHRLALFDGLHTISATLCGYLLFNETLNSSMLIGGLLILSGLTIGNLPDHIANPSSAIPVE